MFETSENYIRWVLEKIQLRNILNISIFLILKSNTIQTELYVPLTKNLIFFPFQKAPQSYLKLK
jgi:hypothetical protein